MKKGFTLLEILVAASIFAVVMVMATGVIGQSSTFQTRLNNMRLVNSDTKRLGDLITMDVRSANTAMAIKAETQTDASYIKRDLRSGVAFLQCNKSGAAYNCKLDDYDDLTNFESDISNPTSVMPAVEPVFGSNHVVNTLVLQEKTDYKVYFTDSDKVYYYKFGYSSGDVIDIEAQIATMTAPANAATYKINDNNLDTNIYFAGYGPLSSSTLYKQSNVMFYITSATLKYTTTDPSNRAKSRLKSMVTSRNYL